MAELEARDGETALVEVLGIISFAALLACFSALRAFNFCNLSFLSDGLGVD